jgi:hypothetical protein
MIVTGNSELYFKRLSSSSFGAEDRHKVPVHSTASAVRRPLLPCGGFAAEERRSKASRRSADSRSASIQSSAVASFRPLGLRKGATLEVGHLSLDLLILCAGRETLCRVAEAGMLRCSNSFRVSKVRI